MELRAVLVLVLGRGLGGLGGVVVGLGGGGLVLVVGLRDLVELSSSSSPHDGGAGLDLGVGGNGGPLLVELVDELVGVLVEVLAGQGGLGVDRGGAAAAQGGAALGAVGALGGGLGAGAAAAERTAAAGPSALPVARSPSPCSTSSIRTMGAPSPGRGPSLRMRV